MNTERTKTELLRIIDTLESIESELTNDLEKFTAKETAGNIEPTEKAKLNYIRKILDKYFTD